jgi:hypothetical protein
MLRAKTAGKKMTTTAAMAISIFRRLQLGRKLLAGDNGEQPVGA